MICRVGVLRIDAWHTGIPMADGVSWRRGQAPSCLWEPMESRACSHRGPSGTDGDDVAWDVADIISGMLGRCR